jgi:hypothetical protein
MMNAVTGQADDAGAMLQTLLDRAAIEQLFIRYYSGFDSGNPEGFGRYFTADAELDVNGYIARNHAEITALYRRVSADKPRLTGTFRMILSNLVLDIQGDRATAQMLWTQTLNDTLKGPPRLIEQGREFDILVKQDGRWRITKRVVIADSGLPDIFDDTYTPRVDFRLPPAG